MASLWHDEAEFAQQAAYLVNLCSAKIGAGKSEPVLKHMAGVLDRLMRDSRAVTDGFVDPREAEAMAYLKAAYPKLHAELERIHA